MANTRKKTRRGAKPAKPYTEMNAEELAEATREYNQPFVADRTKPLTEKQREMIQRARKVGRPKVGNGVKVIALSVEKGLLERADRYAKGRGFSRAQLVAQGLELAMGARQQPSTRPKKSA